MTTAADLQLLTVRETAAYLRISVTKTYQLIRSGDVPAVRVGGQYRIPRTALAQHLMETLRPPA